MLLATLVIGASAGCAANQPPFHAGLPPLETDSTTCQLGDPGVRVRVEDVEDAVDVTVTTIRDVDDLRHRVRDAAAMYGPGAHRGLGHHGKHGNGGHHGLRLAELRPTIKAVEIDVPSGAKIHVTPIESAKLDEVRAEVRARAAQAQWGDGP